jgi:hypothetical protein
LTRLDLSSTHLTPRGMRMLVSGVHASRRLECSCVFLRNYLSG